MGGVVVGVGVGGLGVGVEMGREGRSGGSW